MAVQGQQARRIEWTVAEKKHDPLHSTVRQDAAQVNAAGRWLCWDGGGTGIVTKASPETSPRSGNGFPQAVPVLLFFPEVCCRGRRPVLLRVLVGSVVAVAVAQTKATGGPTPAQRDGAGAGGAETGPATFLLFWVGQERDSVLSRSPAPRFVCSGLRRTKPGGSNALAIASFRSTKWQTLPGRERLRRPRLAQGWSVGIDGRVKPSWPRARSVWADGRSNQPLAQNMVRWEESRAKPS